MSQNTTRTHGEPLFFRRCDDDNADADDDDGDDNDSDSPFFSGKHQHSTKTDEGIFTTPSQRRGTEARA